MTDEAIGPSAPPAAAAVAEEKPDEAEAGGDAADEADAPEDAKDGEEGKEGADDKKKKKKEKEKEAAPPKVLKDKTMGNLKHEDLDWIWIGEAEDARNGEALKRNNVRYVLNCTHPRSEGGVPNFHEKDSWFQYCRVVLGDNATENLTARLKASWEFLERCRVREDGGVLVHCQQGVSRSCSMVISYLMKYYRYSFDDAFALVKAARKQANPNEGFTTQLRELDEQLRTTNGYEKLPPKRKKPVEPAAPAGAAARGPARGPVGPSVGPAVGPARGPAGPARGPVGPAGPPRGPVGPQKGPAGPAPGPAVGPAGPPKPEKRKAAGPAGPAGPPKMKK